MSEADEAIVDELVNLIRGICREAGVRWRPSSGGLEAIARIVKKPGATQTLDINLNLKLPDEVLGRVTGLLETLTTRIGALEAQGKKVLMGIDEQKAMLERINVATNNIADDVRRLTAGATQPGGMTPEQVAETQALGDAIATRLEGIAASTADPVPDVPPVEPPVEGGPQASGRRQR